MYCQVIFDLGHSDSIGMDSETQAPLDSPKTAQAPIWCEGLHVVRRMHVLPLVASLCVARLATLGNGRAVDPTHLGFAIAPAGDVALDEGAATSPFCQKLCNKSNLEEKGAKTCKDLAEDDCKSSNFYRKNGGELRLCVWQPQWKCTEDWTTVCISDRPWKCSSSSISTIGSDLCESICYKTDVRSIDTFCHKLSQEECSSAQFYESDKHGNRRLCEMQSGLCRTSSLCPAENATCLGSTLFDHGEAPKDPMDGNATAAEMLSLCRSMCYKTNTLVSGLSCADLSSAHCSSGQFYETDWHGVRSLCVPFGDECTADSSHSCPRSIPLCSDDLSLQKSLRPGNETSPVPGIENSSHSIQKAAAPLVGKAPVEAPVVPAFCFSLCEKTNTRSMNASCQDLPAASCESEEFYETDHDGRRRLCVQKGGKCITDLSAVCDEHFPICNISAAQSAQAEAPDESEHCLLYCDKINTRSRGQSCETLSSSECLSGIFYESDHDGNRAMCSYAAKGCAANVSSTCRAEQPICHGADAKTTKLNGRGQSSSVVRSSKFAVHSYGSASPAANEAFGGPPAVESLHSGASMISLKMFLINLALLVAICTLTY
eukprot:s822_g36.t1